MSIGISMPALKNISPFLCPHIRKSLHGRNFCAQIVVYVSRFGERVGVSKDATDHSGARAGAVELRSERYPHGMNRAIHAVRAEFSRWLEAECGTWRAWVMRMSLLGVPVTIGLILRACDHSA